MRKLTLLLPLLAAATHVAAHDGHGARGAHLHGWDGPGTLALLVVAGLAAWWLFKGRK